MRDRPKRWSNLVRRFFTRRSMVGALLFLVLVGEPTVAGVNNFVNPFIFLTYYILYLIFFQLIESLIVRYRLVTYQVWLVTFALYSVLITGFFNKELTAYVLQPGDNLWTTVIRIQSSMFTVFALYLLDKVLPRREEETLPVKHSVVALLIYTSLAAFAGWGVPNLIQTLIIAPPFFLAFLLAGLLALTMAFARRPAPRQFSSKLLTAVSLICLVAGAIPALPALLVLFILMPVTFFGFMFAPAFRYNAL